MKIALDVMGGDHAPQNPMGGVKLALETLPQIEKIYLVGVPELIEREMQTQGIPTGPKLEIVPASQVVDMSDSGLDAVRKKKDSSISRAVDLVKDKVADAVVSAGHTGAAVTASLIKLRTLPHIERPAIASVMPSMTTTWLLIDAGANPDSLPEHLVQNALMGSAYARHVMGRENPRVGLMSNGTEEEKGNALCKETSKLLRTTPGINFIGNVEGHDLWETPPDVVVCDGYTGNIILKTSEALAHALFGMIKTEIMSSPRTKIGGLLAKPAFKRIHKKTSADESGGMPLLGLNGITIIAHGGASAYAMKNAIRMACDTISHQVNPHIEAAISKHLLIHAHA
ncbi:phosphate:acyl-[acyl carrier protein] acyltransferase [Prosthecobacter fusiformis]|uniref:Phosphate acyltransferase n=1 Tax=Prosthecobacter fusiformis TaxID=48464 RepID=A0A4R7S3V7_9BACT|nr:phosphate acyltransferase PlsX [Prosthecobacter fusiformis]TDU73021.1 phosphate:acyl-[acyl carrier protein] acyltransferase [Prosthecobacter fusiformis]